MSTAETLEAKELRLVGQVELRIAVAATDEKLQAMLSTYLAPLLLKLASEFPSVRNKVISVCQHINTRIKVPTLQIPVAVLLKQFKDHLQPLVRHFDLLYIQQGVNRLPTGERLDLLPILISGIKNNFDKSAASAAILFNLILRLSHSLSFPARGTVDDSALRHKLSLDKNPDDGKFVATWLGKVFLFQPASLHCAGLTSAECAFLQLHGKRETWDQKIDGGLSFTETKAVVAKFLASGAFFDTERFLPALYMSADTNSRVSEIGEELLKRASSTISYDDPILVQELYKAYLGTGGDTGSLPVRVPLKLKILGLLSRSKQAVTFVQENGQIVQEALNPAATHPSGSNQIFSKGLEASRLRSQAFAFTHWIARMSSKTEVNLIGPNLTGQLRDYIESQGWPRPRPERSMNGDELSSRAIAYESIGLLAAACPDQMLLDPDLDVLRWLFTSLSEDPCGNEVSLSIEQALGSILSAFERNLDSDMQLSLASLFSHHMSLHSKTGEESEGIIRSTRFMAVKFANRCLPYQNVKARWLDVLALCSDINERKEVIEEGKRGLNPYWFQLLNSSQFGSATGHHFDPQSAFPPFAPLIFAFFGPDASWDTSHLKNSRMADGYVSALCFCRNILVHQTLATHNIAPLIDADWEKNIDNLIANDEAARSVLQHEFKLSLTSDQDKSRAFKTYMQACFHAIVSLGSQETRRAGDFVVELFSLVPISEFGGLAVSIERLEEPIFSNDKSLREIASHIFGLLASLKDLPMNALESMIEKFRSKIVAWHQAIGSEVVQTHGAILATAFFVSRCTPRDEQTLNLVNIHKTLVKTIVDILDQSQDKLLLEGVMTAMADLALFGAFLGAIPIDVSKTLERLSERGRQGNEKAVLALGQILMQCHEDLSSESVLTQGLMYLYELHAIRGPEIQFSVGAALTCAASGLETKFLISTTQSESPRSSLANRQHTLATVLEKILLDCKTTKPTLRQAAVIWLLCLIQYCGHLKDVQGRLKTCQSAFKGFLSDRDSLNQESASRGLAIIYEIGSPELKNELIRDLVGSFTGTGSNFLADTKVSEDTELFEEGALPTGDGSIRTYKDIMSLAAEVGDSSLVYRFMSLASNNAIWSSRAAYGRFGLSKVLSDASTNDYLAQNPKLYSALFRYRFDPNSNVRRSMNDIWTALVKEPTVTVNKHFEFIISDLLSNMLGKEWRVRQASCAAIADLLQGRPQETYENHLNEIWTVTFKVCDDIKESVRTAAMALARVLTNILLARLESGDSSSKETNAMLGQILPFLLGPSGLESSAPDVRNFSRKTIDEIIKKGDGKALRPFIPDLVCNLLAQLSSVEPEMINYIHLNADKYGVTVEELDDARLKHIRGSKMLESIERCLDFLDEHAILQLQPLLENAIKTAIGLPSKVGCSRVLVSLSTRQNFIFKPYADRMLLLAQRHALDSNDTVSSSYAASCGYLARLASDKNLLEHIEYCRKLYFGSGDDRHRVIAGNLTHAFSKHATDRFKEFASEALPFTFVAKHDTFEKARDLFEATWNNSVGGSRAVLLYLREITDLTFHYIDSAHWSIKHVSARAIADVVTSSGTSISDKNANMIWRALEKALAGKAWDGKEKTLEALILLASHSSLLSSNPQVAEDVKSIVMREAQRNNIAYRPYALQCLGSFAGLQKSKNLYDQVFNIVSKIITELTTQTSEMDTDSDGHSSRLVGETTLVNATAAVLKAMSPHALDSEGITHCMSQTFDLLTQASRSSFAGKSLKVAVFENLQEVFGRMQHLNFAMSADLEDCLSNYAAMIFSTAEDVEQIRQKAAEAALAMASTVKRGRATLKLSFAQALEKGKTQERSKIVRDKLDQASVALAS